MTCLCPLEPRWGVATVIKFIASKPPIVPFEFLSHSLAEESSTVLILGGLYSLPIVYLATNPPTECAINEILFTFGFLWITSRTYSSNIQSESKEVKSKWLLRNIWNWLVSWFQWDSNLLCQSVTHHIHTI